MKVKRKERLPVNGNDRQILSIKEHKIPLCDCPDKGHKKCVDETHLHTCYVNDYNVERYKQAGYEFWYKGATIGDKRVDSAPGMTDSIVSINAGNGLTAFLMVVPQQWYEEDMGAMERQVAEKESIMKRQIHAQGNYGKVEITENKGDSFLTVK